MKELQKSYSGCLTRCPRAPAQKCAKLIKNDMVRPVDVRSGTFKLSRRQEEQMVLNSALRPVVPGANPERLQTGLLMLQDLGVTRVHLVHVLESGLGRRQEAETWLERQAQRLGLELGLRLEWSIREGTSGSAAAFGLGSALSTGGLSAWAIHLVRNPEVAPFVGKVKAARLALAAR